MRKARERQLEMVQAIVHQRDMFSALYKDACNASGRGDAAASLVRSHAESSPARTAAPSAAAEAGGTSVSAADAQVQSRLLKDLQESFDQYVLGSGHPAGSCRRGVVVGIGGVVVVVTMAASRQLTRPLLYAACCTLSAMRPPAQLPAGP